MIVVDFSEELPMMEEVLNIIINIFAGNMLASFEEVCRRAIQFNGFVGSKIEKCFFDFGYIQNATEVSVIDVINDRRRRFASSVGRLG